MRVLGLIGGMSWRTTELYYSEINRHVASQLGGVRSARLIINSLDYAHIAEYIQHQDFKSLTRLLCQSGNQLKAAGAEALVLCANVVHRCAPDIERQVGLQVLHIVDFTAREIVKHGHKKIGLLATRAVMEEEFYVARLKQRYGLDVLVPSKTFRREADRLIFDELSKENIPEQAAAKVRDAYEELVEQGVESVVLGCTEFRLVFREQDMTVPTFETTTLHARGVAEWALSNG